MTTITKAYTYQRKDGGTTDCYGNINDFDLINFSLVCENEYWDEIVEFDVRPSSWAKVCKKLDATINNLKVEEITLI